MIVSNWTHIWKEWKRCSLMNTAFSFRKQNISTFIFNNGVLYYDVVIQNNIFRKVLQNV